MAMPGGGVRPPRPGRPFSRGTGVHGRGQPVDAPTGSARCPPPHLPCLPRAPMPDDPTDGGAPTGTAAGLGLLPRRIIGGAQRTKDEDASERMRSVGKRAPNTKPPSRRAGPEREEAEHRRHHKRPRAPPPEKDDGAQEQTPQRTPAALYQNVTWNPMLMFRGMPRKTSASSESWSWSNPLNDELSVASCTYTVLKTL